jgi:diacylglycerol kinase family enzyme
MDLISTYANGVSKLTEYSRTIESSPLVVDLIANPHAGFFKSKKTVEKLIWELDARLEELRRKYPRRKIEINNVHFTEYAGHAYKITEDILNREEKSASGLEHLLIGCGGDGTSNEICTALVEAKGDLLSRLKLLRLPLGTGNDVADTKTFAEAYDLILGTQHTEKNGTLLVTLAGKGERYAFNVGSVGLDAFIADLTNRFKRMIPGHAYKLLVDVGSLFYDQTVKPRQMNVRIHYNGAITEIKGIVPSMVVVGVSGHRTYGGQMPILPGRENVCIIDGMDFFAKLRSKKLLYVGKHGQLPEVRFYFGDRVDIEYDGNMPLQLDGELTWLERRDFPVSMKVLPGSINVLRP